MESLALFLARLGIFLFLFCVAMFLIDELIVKRYKKKKFPKEYHKWEKQWEPPLSG